MYVFNTDTYAAPNKTYIIENRVNMNSDLAKQKANTEKLYNMLAIEETELYMKTYSF